MNAKYEKAIDMYYNKKMKQVDIAKELNLSQSTIGRMLKKDNRYHDEKELRKAQNRKRHIEDTKEYIKEQRKSNQLKNSIDDLILKELHRSASIELSKRSKLSNITYKNWNTSAYSFNEEKKRFEFKENELGRSFDVPQFIKLKR